MRIADAPSWQSIFHAAALGVALAVFGMMPAFGPNWRAKEIAEFVAVVFIVIRGLRYFVTGRYLVN